MFQGLQILIAVTLGPAEAQNLVSHSSFLQKNRKEKLETALLNRAQVLWGFKVQASQPREYGL